MDSTVTLNFNHDGYLADNLSPPSLISPDPKPAARIREVPF